MSNFIEDILGGDPCDVDGITRAIHILTNLSEAQPDSLRYFAGGLADEAREFMTPGWQEGHDYPNECALIAASLHLLLESLANGAGPSKEVRDRFKEGGR